MYSPKLDKECEPHFCTCDKSNKGLFTDGFWWHICPSTSMASRIEPFTKEVIYLDLRKHG